MSPKVKSAVQVIAIGLILAGLVGQFGPMLMDYVPIIAPQTEVKLAAIIGESSMQSGLSKEQIGVLQLAPDYGVLVQDRNVVDRDRKTPEELKPLIDAVTGQTEYKLVIQYTSGSVKVLPLPSSIGELKEQVQYANH